MRNLFLLLRTKKGIISPNKKITWRTRLNALECSSNLRKLLLVYPIVRSFVSPLLVRARVGLLQNTALGSDWQLNLKLNYVLVYSPSRGGICDSNMVTERKTNAKMARLTLLLACGHCIFKHCFQHLSKWFFYFSSKEMY